VWVESYGRGVHRWRPDTRRSEQIAQLPEGHVPDGLKIAGNGDVWITTFMGSGVDILRSDGTPVDFLETGGTVLNCVFHQGDLIITDMGDIEGLNDAAPMDGSLWRVEGMLLFRGAVTPRTA